LDHQFFQDTQAVLPAMHFSPTVLDYIDDYVTNQEAITTEYFQKIHWWMPVISKKRLLDQNIHAPFQSSTGDTLLLKLTMKIILWNPSQQPQSSGARSQAYLGAKHAISEFTNLGILTLRLLQAQLLIAIYELGHAIVSTFPHL
jgi:hypothetical protein